MSGDPSGMQSAAARLRWEFDRGFAAAADGSEEDFEDVLAISVAGDPYVLRARELSGVVQTASVVPVPSAVQELLGIVQVRGTLVPLYSLSALLGYGRRGDHSGWIALSGGIEPFGLDVGKLEAYVRIPRSAFRVPHGDRGVRRHVRELARTELCVRAVIDLTSVEKSIKTEARRADSAHS